MNFKPDPLRADQEFAWLCDAWLDGIYSAEEYIARSAEIGYREMAERAVADFKSLMN